MNNTQNPFELTCEDFSVTGEKFELKYDAKQDILITTPQPKEADLGLYYKSEDYISHTDGKRNVFEKVYQFVKGIALKRKLKLIDGLETDGKALLDIGCGTGDFLQVSKLNGWTVFGIEPNKQARNLANKKVGGFVFDVDQLEHLKTNSFDVITLWHVLEHLPNLDDEIKTIKRLLKEDGTLIIAVPNFKSFDADYYKSFWAAYDVPRHLWHFSQNGISQIFKKQNMSVVKTLPLVFDAFYVSLLSEKYKTGSMNVFKAFQVGMQSNIKAKRSGEYSSLIYLLKNE